MAAQPLVEGATATNPTTGQKIVYRQGKWQPLNAVANALAPGAGYMGSKAVPKLAPQDMGALTAYRTQADDAQGLRSSANRFAALNKDVGTGFGFALPGVKEVRGMFDPRVSEMQSIAAEITPKMRQAGSGTMSDRDLALYKAATVGLDKPGDTNVSIARVIDAGTRRAQDHASFMDEYARRNGNLVGAQEAWSSYTEANPLFEAGPKGTAVKPAKPWRQWFGLEGEAPAAPKRTTAAKSGARPPLADIFK